MHRNRSKALSLHAMALVLIAGAIAAGASTVGISPPAEPLTQARIAQLPKAQRGAWLNYLARSSKQRQADKDALQAELKSTGIKSPTEPPHGFGARGIPLDKATSWYADPQALHIADVIVSFQIPSGGWGKNMDMSKEPRRPGEAFVPNNISRLLSPGDFDTPLEPEWNYVGTIDNDATITQIHFLAKVITAVGVKENATYNASFLRGMDYLFAAQFPNGGWPQVWPLEGGYHDAITYNDDAMTQVVELMLQVAQGHDEFAFVPQSMRVRAAASFTHGIQCILASQVVVNGKPTVWPQQADALTLKPVSARNFEPPALCSSESATLMMLLMDDLPHPTATEQRSIRAAAAWLQKTAVHGQRWVRTPEGSQLIPSAGAVPLWSRYYQVGTDLPIFGDRDKSIHDQVNELSVERQHGYRWFSPDAQRALDCFEKWNTEHPESK
ncbi:MAG: pectate lyase [Terracidiphilus sp.]|nr:pectate lyase [Terracidiphilus sp.]MDR3775839.1 pectate lyase [Terracidiphilus sp.]